MEAMRKLPQKVLSCQELTTEQAVQACYECSTYLTSLDLGEERFALCQKIIGRCLPYLDAVSTKLAVNIVCQMSLRYDLRGEPLTKRSLRAYRHAYIVDHLRVWERVASTIDRTWKPNDPANMVGGVSPPGGNYPGPVSPEDVKETDIRARYEAMIEADRRKGDRNVEQIAARRLQEAYLRRLKDAVYRAYNAEPPSKDESDTFAACLRVYVSDENVREELQKAMTTPPAPPKLHPMNGTGMTPTTGGK